MQASAAAQGSGFRACATTEFYIQRYSQFIAPKLPLQGVRTPEGRTIPLLVTVNLQRNLTGSLGRVFISCLSDFILAMVSSARHSPRQTHTQEDLRNYFRGNAIFD